MDFANEAIGQDIARCRAEVWAAATWPLHLRNAKLWQIWVLDWTIEELLILREVQKARQERATK